MPIVFPCSVCKTPLSAEETQSGSMVRCPTCLSALKVPSSVAKPANVVPHFAAPPSIGRPGTPIGRRYGFNCAYCSSRLEATESMAAQEGQCPTCGNTITIPILDRYGRLIDPHTREVIKQDPHPVHAYAAAGDRAPKIIRTSDDKQSIQCARCKSYNSINANNCRSCGMPFTMEGTTIEATGNNNGFCVAALVLGILGIPLFCSVITPVLAIVFGIIGYTQTRGDNPRGTGRGMAIIGICCGAIGTLLTLNRYLR